jgi:uncharacterized protein (DUF1778 family)
MKTKNFTKKPMVFSSFRAPAADIDLLRVAAGRQEISQSEFLREAIREKAQRVLLNDRKTESGA